MHFDDGTNPWIVSENTLKIFSWDGYGAAPKTEVKSMLLVVMTGIWYLIVR